MNASITPAGTRRAIVLGASMAGLAAARVLASHFDDVLLIERDDLPDSAVPRKGVPQGRQLHGLLQRGARTFDSLFPGIIQSLKDKGAVEVDFSNDLRWYHFGVDKVRFPSGVCALMMTRPFFEQEVRRRIRDTPKVRVLAQCDVLGLVSSEDRRRITGVKVRHRDASGALVTEVLTADLVADACGRGSLTPKWLAELGLSKPEESRVRVDLVYATRIYKQPDPAHRPDYKSLYAIGMPPEGKRIGIIGPIEGDRWVTLTAGMLGDHPPSDPEGYLQYAKGLPVDDMYRLLRHAEPLSDVVLHKFPSYQRRHYERLRDLPEGLVVLGDAHCSFNPIYGQGMTTAVLSAQLLGTSLSAHQERNEGSLDGLSRSYQESLASLVDIPWLMATGEDFRYPEVEAERPIGYPILEWLMGRLHESVAHDRVLAKQFLLAMHMMEPPTSLFSPRFLWRILAGGIAS
jgi:2-polyprenyl-6-methoxyphenol hydroxylase-like FAD-dependent oxidoreductase